ncbi:MAG: LamG-like jellyroll fold domain-containing protein, partial [Nanoarchaeota archaeon]
MLKRGIYKYLSIIFTLFVFLPLVYAQNLVTVVPNTASPGDNINIIISPKDTFYKTAYLFDSDHNQIAPIELTCESLDSDNTETCKNKNDITQFTIPVDLGLGEYTLEVYDYNTNLWTETSVFIEQFLSSDLIAYYDFENNADDKSGNGHHGTAKNGVTFSSGKIGDAANLDGINDFIEIDDSTIFDFPNQDFTITAWVKTTSTDARSIIAKGTSNLNGGWGIYLGYGSTPGQIVYNWGNGGVSAIYGGTLINDGQWHHIAIIITTSTSLTNNNDAKIYIDGIIQGLTKNINYPYKVNTINDLTIGARIDGTGMFWKGAIDELKIYNKALTAEEIENSVLADNDGDGFSTNSDCDDNNPSINPGMPEICDNLDNSCDGDIDTEDSIGCVNYYNDKDGDGYGDPYDSKCLCWPEEPYDSFYGNDYDETSFRIIEDAEDTKIDGWSVYDNWWPPWETRIENIADPDNEDNRIIHLMGKEHATAFRKDDDSGNVWQERDKFILEWDMKFSEPYDIYILARMTDGSERYLAYTDSCIDNLVVGDYIYYGLCSKADGQWHNIIRDLEKDVRDAGL